MTEHLGSPHRPGTAYECPACEERCHCGDGLTCLFCDECGPYLSVHPWPVDMWYSADVCESCQACGLDAPVVVTLKTILDGESDAPEDRLSADPRLGIDDGQQPLIH